MKYFLALTLLLLCITLEFHFSTSLPSSQPSWRMTKTRAKTTGLRFLRQENEAKEVNKRQSQGNGQEIPDSCNFELIRLLCETGLSEQIVKTSLKCKRNEDASSIASQCDRNEVGRYCGVYAYSNIDDEISSADFECFSRFSTPPTDGSCPSAECAGSLEVLRNSRSRCCVDSLYNATHYNTGVVNRTLWSQCNVETLEKCEQTISRTPIRNAKNCTYIEYYTQFYNVYCSSTLNTIIDEVEQMEGCSGFGVDLDADALCQINSKDEFCQLTENRTIINSALIKCRNDQSGSSCSDGCREALETIKREQECCFNLMYNSSSSGVTFSVSEDEMGLANYTLWNECGVETPPLTCRNLLSKAHGKDLAILMLVLSLLVAMWNI